MADYVSELANYVIPPRRSQVIVLTLDTTARAYDMQSLTYGRSRTPGTAGWVNPDRVYLRLQAITANIYFYFANDNTVTLDKTATIAAGSALANANTYADFIPAGTFVDVCISRDLDKYLHIQGSAAGTLILRHSSDPRPGDH